MHTGTGFADGQMHTGTGSALVSLISTDLVIIAGTMSLICTPGETAPGDHCRYYVSNAYTW